MDVVAGLAAVHCGCEEGLQIGRRPTRLPAQGRIRESADSRSIDLCRYENGRQRRAHAGHNQAAVVGRAVPAAVDDVRGPLRLAVVEGDGSH